MNGNNKALQSRLKISEDVILTVAKLAALDVKGVARLNGDISASGKLFGRGPIKIVYMGDVIAVEIKILIKSGTKACVVAENVQNAVKEDIQNMLGATVARVDVVVDGVEFE